MSYHTTCTIDYPQELYELCEELGTFKYMTGYPCLLLKWQIHHPVDTIRIATIASHRLDHHKYCDSMQKCWTVEKFIQKYGTEIV